MVSFETANNDLAEAAESPNTLTKTERWNITFLVLAFSCVVASVTLVVGTGAIVILSVGGSPSLSPFSLAFIFMGMSMVSLVVTHWIFAQWGRRIGFWFGCGLGVVGALVGCWGLIESSPTLVLFAQFLMGGALGIGMYLRFSAVEIVPPAYSSKAVAWVLGGGCLAAFIGPEMSQVTKGLFGDGNLTFVGTFVATGCFFLLQALCVGLVGFPSSKIEHQNGSSEVDGVKSEADEESLDEKPVVSTDDGAKVAISAPPIDDTSLWSILTQSTFLLPLGVSILAWTIMAMPMGIFRVAMSDLGYTERQSLTIIEFHFLGMYGPGFWSGAFISKHGCLRACLVGLVFFVISIGINMSVQDNNKSIAAWFLGLLFVGVGWNFAFSSATVWSTKAYQHAVHLKPKVQAANECGMFLVSGGAMFSTGYLYENAGGGGLAGWRLLNATLFAFVGLYIGLIFIAHRWNKLQII